MHPLFIPSCDLMSTRTFSSHLPPIHRSTTWHDRSNSQAGTSSQAGTIARDGANLATKPFIRPRKSSEGPVRFEWAAVGRDGKHHEFFQVFEPPDGMSLPGPTAGRVITALFSIPPEKTGEHFEVTTRLSALSELCRLSKNGTTNRHLRRAICRLEGVRIKTNSFWDAGSQQYMDDTPMSLLSSYDFDGGKIKIRWSPDVIEMVNTWTKPTRLDHLFELRSCLSRKLYQISSLGIYQEGKMVEDLEILCHGHLGIRQSQGLISEMKDSLKDPVMKLREKNLVDITFRKEDGSSFGSGWSVCARPMERMLEVCEDIEDKQYWACHLANRGVRDLTDNPARACRELVDNHGVDRARMAVQEYDRRKESSDTAPIKSPGWMVSVIRGDIDLGDPDTGSEPEIALVDYQSAPAPEESYEETKPVGQMVATYIQMAEKMMYQELYSEAQEFIRNNPSFMEPGEESGRAKDRKIGELYLEREGKDELPDSLFE